MKFAFSFTNWKEDVPYMYMSIPNDVAKELSGRIDSLESQKAMLVEEIKEAESRVSVSQENMVVEISQLNDKKVTLKKIDKAVEKLRSDLKTTHDTEVKIPFSPTIDTMSKYLLVDLIKDIVNYSCHASSERKNSKAYKEETLAKELISAQRARIEEMAENVRTLLDDFSVDYIQAHGVTQKTLFSTTGSMDHIANTIKNFMLSRAWKSDEIGDFIRYWMHELHIGYDYKVEDVEGEAYKVFILESADDSKGFPLADLGMGSIQLMMLLFALATSIKRNIGTVFGNPMVVVEEPEQNLHPAVQSRLADILYQVNEKFGLKFIVETHSEYFIRRTQVIVAENNKNKQDWKNPFVVYYFPGDDIPYEMGFQKNGKFLESFGTGFFDVADNAAVELFEYDED
jgi:hypothetical protein